MDGCRMRGLASKTIALRYRMLTTINRGWTRESRIPMSISPGHGVGPPMNRTRWSAALGALILAVALSGCACSFEEYPDGARAAVEEFTELLNKRDADKAAKLTTQPTNAAASLRQIFQGL